MKRRNIILAASAIVLTVAGAIAGRASAKFTTAPSVFYTRGGACQNGAALLGSGAVPSQFQTTGTTQASIATSTSGSPAKLYYTSNCSSTKKVFFHA